MPRGPTSAGGGSPGRVLGAPSSYSRVGGGRRYADLVVDRAFGRDLSPLPGGRNVRGATPLRNTSPRSTPRSTKLDDLDRFEWVIVFGGTKAEVQRMKSLPEDENPYLVLQEAFMELLTPDGRKRMLKTELQFSIDGDEVFLLVGAEDDDVLMQEAEEIGFTKRVINIDRPEDIVSQARDPSRWTTNCDGDRGSIVGYAPFKTGLTGDHLQWFEDPKHNGDRESEFYPPNRFFSSGERQRLVRSLMNRCTWESPRAKFGIEHVEDGVNRYYFNTDMAEKDRPMKETLHPLGGAASRAGADRDLFLKDIYPLHCESERAWLEKNWGSFELAIKHPFSQPLDQIRRYYGTHIGLYFAWLELYTKALVFPAFCGFMLFVVEEFSGAASTNELGHVLTVYSIFLALWCTLFIEAWKRRENELKHDWGTEYAEEEETTRPQFFDSQLVEIQVKPWGEAVKVLPFKQKCIRALVSLATIVALCIGVGIVAGVALWMKAEAAHLADKACKDVGAIDNMASGPDNHTSPTSIGLDDDDAPPMVEVDVECYDIPNMTTLLSYGGSFMNLAFITLFTQFYTTASKFLTDAEVHRTQTSYNDSLIMKGFCFEFINRYFLLFYIAFFKSGEFMGTPDTCDVVNEAVVVDGIEGEVPVPDCINDLATQLKVVFVFKTIVQQIKEIYYPDIKRCYRRWRETRGLEEPEELDELDELGEEASPRTRRRRGGLTYVEEQNIMDSYEHPFPATYDDFQEMTIQFGFMTLFAVAYPIGALFALANNILEIRVDGQKLTTDCRRPRYRDAEDIGSWMTVLQCITVCAVITNSLLVSFSSTTLVQDLGKSVPMQLTSTQNLYRLPVLTRGWTMHFQIRRPLQLDQQPLLAGRSMAHGVDYGAFVAGASPSTATPRQTLS